MRCYRMMFDAMAASEPELAAIAGFFDIFDGILPENAVKEAPPDEIDAAQLMLLCLYRDVKSEGKGKQTLGGGHPVRGLYKGLLDAHGLMPDEIDRQDPKFLFQILSGETERAVDVDAMPPGVRKYYGF